MKLKRVFQPNVEGPLRELFYGYGLGTGISYDDFLDKVAEAISKGTVVIHNDGEEPEHTQYFLDGDPARSLDCMCEKCLDYFANE